MRIFIFFKNYFISLKLFFSITDKQIIHSFIQTASIKFVNNLIDKMISKRKKNVSFIKKLIIKK